MMQHPLICIDPTGIVLPVQLIVRVRHQSSVKLILLLLEKLHHVFHSEEIAFMVCHPVHPLISATVPGAMSVLYAPR